MPVPGHDYTERSLAAEQAKRDAQSEVDELLWLMSDKRGRRFVWRLLEKAHVWQLSMTFGPDGDRATVFREGERNVGNQLFSSILQHCPNRLTEMQKEAKRNERSSSTSS